MMDNARLVAEEVQIDLEGDDQGGALRLDQPKRIDELIARYDQVLDQVAVLEARIQSVLDGLVKPGVGVGAEGSAA
jgi:hypothetical protein